jgi:hypothetical protein
VPTLIVLVLDDKMGQKNRLFRWGSSVAGLFTGFVVMPPKWVASDLLTIHELICIQITGGTFAFLLALRNL